MKISYEEYKDAQTRFDAYVKEHNTDPENIRIGSSNIKTTDLIALSKVNPSEFPIEYGGVVEDKPPVKSQLDMLFDKFGRFNTICDFYDKVIRKCNYSYYYNQRTNVKDVIDTLVSTGTIGLNCFGADTELIIKNNDTEVYELVTIEELANRNIGLREYSTPSFNIDEEFVWVDIAAAYSTGFKELFEIDTKNRTKLTVTEDHAIFASRNENIGIHTTKKTSIKDGLNAAFRTHYFFGLNGLKLNYKDIIIGFWLGDGYYSNKVNKRYKIRVLLQNKVNFLRKILKDFEHVEKTVMQNNKIYTQFEILDEELISELSEISDKKGLKHLCNKEQMLGMFCGLLASDGNVRYYQGRFKFNFLNSNKEIVDLFALCAKLIGFVPYRNIRDFSKQESSFTNDSYHVVDFTDFTDFNPDNFLFRAGHHEAIYDNLNKIKEARYKQGMSQTISRGDVTPIGVHETFNLTVLDSNHAIFAGFDKPVLVSQCTDWSMFTAWICLQLGYKFRIYNRVCSSGAGHVNMSIYSEDGWYSSDPAAVSDQGDRRYNCLNDVWCDTKNGSRIVDTSNENELLGWMHY